MQESRIIGDVVSPGPLNFNLGWVWAWYSDEPPGCNKQGCAFSQEPIHEAAVEDDEHPSFTVREPDDVVAGTDRSPVDNLAFAEVPPPEPCDSPPIPPGTTHLLPPRSQLRVGISKMQQLAI